MKDIIERCISQIKDWMTANFLRLNSDKTEVLLIGSPFQLKKLSSVQICMEDSVVFSSDYVKNLGSYFDKSLSMDILYVLNVKPLVITSGSICMKNLTCLSALTF